MKFSQVGARRRMPGYPPQTKRKLSIERQLYGIEQYCENAGLKIIVVLCRRGHHPEPNMDRCRLHAPDRGCRAGLFDCVVIYDMTRGSRDMRTGLTFRKEMKRFWASA
jgi:DNA invertase Pin-like site-specific DNA recombinase